MSIYIGLYRGKSAISRMIRWFTWSPYSHASIIVMDGSSVLSVFEAWRKGVTETHCVSYNADAAARLVVLFRAGGALLSCG